MKKRTDLDEKVQEVAAVWVKLYRAQMAVSARVLSRLPARTSHAQLAVMEALDTLGPMCQRELSEKILKSAGNVTVVVDTLERRGFVQRVRSETDRRMYLVHVTPQGHDWLAQILRPLMESVVEEFSVLTQAEREQLGRLCRKLGLGSRGGSPAGPG